MRRGSDIDSFTLSIVGGDPLLDTVDFDLLLCSAIS